MTLHEYILLKLHNERAVAHAFALLMLRCGVRMTVRTEKESI